MTEPPSARYWHKAFTKSSYVIQKMDKITGYDTDIQRMIPCVIFSLSFFKRIRPLRKRAFFFLAEKAGNVFHGETRLQGGGDAVAHQTAQLRDPVGHIAGGEKEVGGVLRLLPCQFLGQ